MKVVQANTPAPQQASVSTHAAMWSTLKMLIAAIFCGVTVSLLAAGIAIVLANDAEARPIEKDIATTAVQRPDDIRANDNEEFPPTPGALLIGDGCDGMSLQAIERDWQVSIDGNRIRVRVMQAFVLPAESSQVANFHVQLPRGARLRSLAAQTQNKDLAGHLISDEQYDRLTSATYLKLTHNRLLVSHSANGTVMTSPILNLRADEVVTIQYAYEIAADGENGNSSFKLPLAPADHSADGTLAAAEHGFVSQSPLTKAAVWVEWVGRKPTKVVGLPVDADLEITKSRVEGFSWAASDIRPGASLQLAWSLQEI